MADPSIALISAASEDQPAWLTALIAFVLFGAPAIIATVSVVRDSKRRRLHRDQPEEFYRQELERWARKNPEPPTRGLVPVSFACPVCGEQPVLGSPSLAPWTWRLRGKQKSSDSSKDLHAWVREDPNRAAWISCTSCGHSAGVVGQHPWTMEDIERQRQLVQRREQRRATEQQRQAAQERRRKNQVSTKKGLRSLSPRQFERAVAKILAVNGYRDVAVTGGPGDLTADIKCMNEEGETVVVQCKRYLDKLVGSRELQSFIGMLTVEHRADKGVYVTTSDYTGPASDLALRHGVELVNGDQLVELAQALHVSWDDEAIQALLKDPPKPKRPPPPPFVRRRVEQARARQRREARGYRNGPSD